MITWIYGSLALESRWSEMWHFCKEFQKHRASDISPEADSFLWRKEMLTSCVLFLKGLFVFRFQLFSWNFLAAFPGGSFSSSYTRRGAPQDATDSRRVCLQGFLQFETETWPSSAGSLRTKFLADFRFTFCGLGLTPRSSELPAQCRNIRLQPWDSCPHTTLFLGRGEVSLGSLCTGLENLYLCSLYPNGLVWVTCPLMTKSPEFFLKGREKKQILGR